MTRTKSIITALGLLSLMQTATAAPNEIQSNVTPDVLVAGLSIQTEQNFSGTPRNGKSTVYAKNAHSYANGLCAFKGDFLLTNDSAVKLDQLFQTEISYNDAPNFVYNTKLGNTGNGIHQFTVYLKPGNNNVIKVHADKYNTIHETDEMNNHLTRRVKVIGKCEAQSKPSIPALNKLKGEGNTLPHQAKQANDARLPSTTAPSDYKPRKKWDPNDARLPSSKRKPLAPTTKLKGKGNTEPQQAKQECKYDPNSARLPCMGGKRKPKMKLINPFE